MRLKTTTDVAGHCPMGCGRTLFLADGGYITCTWHRCPNPTAVADLLEDPETEHIVELEPFDFVVKPPLRERLDGDLFTCDLHRRIAELDGPPLPDGRFRVTVRADDWTWTRLDTNTTNQKETPTP